MIMRNNCALLSGGIPEWRPFIVERWDAEKVSAIIDKEWNQLAVRYLSLQGMIMTFGETVGEERWNGDDATKDITGAATLLRSAFAACVPTPPFLLSPTARRPGECLRSSRVDLVRRLRPRSTLDERQHSQCLCTNGGFSFPLPSRPHRTRRARRRRSAWSPRRSSPPSRAAS